MKATIEKQRRNYVEQLQSAEARRKRLVDEIEMLDKQTDQLNGAIFAVDQLLVSVSQVEKEEAAKKKELEAKAAALAVEEAKVQVIEAEVLATKEEKKEESNV